MSGRCYNLGIHITAKPKREEIATLAHVTTQPARNDIVIKRANAFNSSRSSG